jgi:ribosomal protein L35AE/L33A
MLGHTSLATTAVLASKRRSNHTDDAEVGIVVFPGLEKVVNDGFLLGNAIHFRHKAWVVSHGSDIEKGRRSKSGSEGEIQKRV